MELRKHTFTRPENKDSREHIVTEIRLYSENRERIFLEFCPVYVSENTDIQAKDFDTFDSLRIFISDYEKLVSPFIEKLFPLKGDDPYYGGAQEKFDATGENWLCAEEWLRLKDMLAENSRISSPEEQGFYDEVLRYFAWAENKSGLFCISGNL